MRDSGLAAVALTSLIVMLTSNGRGECVVSGKEVSLDGILVKTARDRFHVDVRRVSMSAHLPRWKHGWFELAITDALAFEGVVRDLPLYVRSHVATPTLDLALGTRIVHAHAAGNEVIGSVVLEQAAALDCDPEVPSIILTPVRIPCSAVGLFEADVEDAPRRSAPETTGEAPPAWSLRDLRREARLWSLPQWNAPTMTLKKVGAGYLRDVHFQEIDREGDWIQVRGWGKGTYYIGWMRRTELMPIPSLNVYSQGGLAGCTVSESGSGGGEALGSSSTAYRGKARVASGAIVYAKGPWATVTRSIDVDVRYEFGSKRVRLIDVPGLSGSEWSAFVPVEFVELPKALTIRR
jgi:hypothetical protein